MQAEGARSVWCCQTLETGAVRADAAPAAGSAVRDVFSKFQPYFLRSSYNQRRTKYCVTDASLDTTLPWVSPVKTSSAAQQYFSSPLPSCITLRPRNQRILAEFRTVTPLADSVLRLISRHARAQWRKSIKPVLSKANRNLAATRLAPAFLR